MKWLQFGGSNTAYINTGVVPKSGYTITTTVRSDQPATCGLFGSRTSDGATDCLDCYLITADNAVTFQCDYGGKGSVISIPRQTWDLSMKIYTITVARTSDVNGVTYQSNRNNTNGTYPCYIGTVNTANSSDGRMGNVDFGEFIIRDSNGNDVFHGYPVEKGNTEYSTTPAPSNCMWDSVSKSYKQKSGGDGILWIDDDSKLADTGNVVKLNTADYGMKVLFDEDSRVFNMNSKYRLLGADITSTTSQFKTYDLTIAGDAPEPSLTWDAYIYDNQYHTSYSYPEKESLAINTGLPSDTLKVITIDWDEVKTNMGGARGHEYWNGDTGTNVNSYVVPNSVTVGTNYVNNARTATIYVDGTMNKTQVIGITGCDAVFPAIGDINGGQPTWNMSWGISARGNVGISISFDSNGVLHVYTSMFVSQMQRAYRDPTYGFWWESRAYGWLWLTGFTFRVSILNTPYKI